MSFLVARIEHAARVLASTLARKLAEKCSGASDYLDAYQPIDVWSAQTPAEFDQLVDSHNAEVARKRLVDREAEQEVAEPSGVVQCPFGAQECVCDRTSTGCPEINDAVSTLGTLSQSPAASAGRGESSSPGVSAGPTSTAPSGERISWIDWAAPAICDVLAEHRVIDTGANVWCEDSDHVIHVNCHDTQEWREHVAPLIAERLEAASKARFYIDDGEPQTVALNAVEYERFLDGWLNTGRECAKRPTFPCVVTGCMDRFASYDELNTHSYWEHLEPDPFKASDDPLVTWKRYPGASPTGDFKWFGIKVTSSPAHNTQK